MTDQSGSREFAEAMQAAESAADHAGPAWADSAFDAFVAFAETHERFTVEKLRASMPDFPEPPDARAWGHVTLRAFRHKIVAQDGHERTANKRCSNRLVPVWRSLIL